LVPRNLWAERVAWQAALVNYLNLTGSKVYESEAVTTEGTITNITANWDFSGSVHLEVSANNGVNYVSIVNGFPLVKGFVPGNQLRYRVILEPKSLLRRITLFYTDNKVSRHTFGNPELSGFTYRKAIYIENSLENELVNYQLKIKVGEARVQVPSPEKTDVYCDGKIKADFKDIRFICADGETNLAYYLESVQGERPNRFAIFWVKIPQLPKKGVNFWIYLYYSNPKAQDLTLPNEVFDFFEGFKGKSLDLEKWEIYNELKGEAGIVGAELRLNNSTILSRIFKLENGIIEFKARIQGACGIQGIVRDKKENSLYSSVNQTVYASNFLGAEHTIAVGNIVKVNIGKPIVPDKYYIYRVIAEGPNLIFERYDARDFNKEVELRFSDIGGLSEGHIGLRGDCMSGNEGAVYFDWIRVRQYTADSPKVLSIGDEEAN